MISVQIEELKKYINSSDKINLGEDGKISIKDKEGVVKSYAYNKKNSQWTASSVVKDGIRIELSHNLFVKMLIEVGLPPRPSKKTSQ